MASICTALNLSDDKPCTQEATNSNGIFCAFHARQVQGLYKGYKKRSAALEALEAAPPSCLASLKTPLRDETFSALQDEESLNEVYKYLFRRQNLIDRVIRARKLHHAHFYSQNMDWGHQQYLARLAGDKVTVLRAMGRLTRRIAEVLYKRKKWFKWVREQQDEEEAGREKEVEKIKKEAKLFSRHMKQVEARLSKKKQDEDQRRQDAFLDQAYEERLRQTGSSENTEYEEEWDPIEDSIESEREDFIALLKRLLWIEDEDFDDESPAPRAKESHAQDRDENKIKMLASGPLGKENTDPDATPTAQGQATETALSRDAKKRAKAKAKAIIKKDEAKKEKEASRGQDSDVPKIEVDETRAETRRRLLAGNEYKPNPGVNVAENSLETGSADMYGKIPGMPEQEAEKILDEVAEIKELLFCRLLIPHWTLLPAALRAQSIAAFLADPEVGASDVRDVCLQLEQPSLQALRDACADLARGDQEESDDEEEEEDEQTAHHRAIINEQSRRALNPDEPGFLRREEVPETWRSQHELDRERMARNRIAAEEDSGAVIDFGIIDDQGNFQNKKMRVTICGKSIWNYPSEKAMARGGWLQYSIIAKGSRFEDAVALCRNCDEFWELSTLAIFNYFPTNNWSSWKGDVLRKQLLQFGLIPYMVSDKATELTKKHPQVYEETAIFSNPNQPSSGWKNVLCTCMKRNDPSAGVRDVSTGRILVEPPTEHLWLVRRPVQYGRNTSPNPFHVMASVDEKMFETFDAAQKDNWRFGFNEYYDITIWNLEPGVPYAGMYNLVHDALVKARRCCHPLDMYEPVADILKTLHRESSQRVRGAKPGETTILDDLQDPQNFRFMAAQTRPGGAKWVDQFPEFYFYNESDANEDAILFPEEVLGREKTAITRYDDPISRLESFGPVWKKFTDDLDSESSDDEVDSTPRRLETNPLTEPMRALTMNQDPADIPPCPDPNNMDCECRACLYHDEQELALTSYGREEDNLSVATVDFEEHIEDQQVAAQVRDWALDEDLFDCKRNPEQDFYTYVEREKAKPMKNAWHAAEQDPKERARWTEMQKFIKKVGKVQILDVEPRVRAMEPLYWLGVHTSEHRLVWGDVLKAIACVSLFFPDLELPNSSLAKWRSEQSTLPELLDDKRKAENMLPYARGFRSNFTLPNAVLKESTDEFQKKRKPGDNRESRRCTFPMNREEYPRDWDMFLRPTLAKLYKAGVIAPGHISYPAGQALPVTEGEEKEKTHKLDVDYRRLHNTDWWPKPSAMSHITDPYRIDLLKTAKDWRSRHGDSVRFSLFRIWTGEVVLPLTVGYDRRAENSFADAVGRSWSWKFIPRDKPGSEWSMQYAADLLLKRFMTKKKFRGEVEVKRDMVLVVGTDEKDLRRYATGVVFALQGKPWRMEVDFGKSFGNVDWKFLEGLDEKWLE